MNPATSILFLGLVLSTAQGFEVKTFTADPDKPAEGSQVTLTATPDGVWKKCTVTLDKTNICDITKSANKSDTTRFEEDKYLCIHLATNDEPIGNCGVKVFAAQAGLLNNCMTK